MKLAVALALLGASGCLAAGGAAAAYARAVHDIALDPEQCYRVRDLAFQKDDLKFYLNDGHLIFAKPTEGRILGAVFTADVPGGDGEVILFPPSRSERMSLATFANTPNLGEHFSAAVFAFSDNTAVELLDQIQSGEPRKAEEVGHVLAGRYSETLRNIAESYSVRVVQDHFSARREAVGFFYAAVSGKRFGNIDLVFDPRQRDQITVGQVVYRDNRQFFDVWTSFQARSFRTGQRTRPEWSVSLQNVNIDAAIQPDLSMKAVTRLTFTARESTDTAIPFELSASMRVTGARLNGEPIEIFDRTSLRADLVRQGGGNSIFLAVLPKPLGKGETHVLEFEHEGNVISSAGNNVYFVASRTNWYPNRDAAFAMYELTFRHPANLQLVATGELAEESVDGGERVARYTTSSPIRFAGFNLGTYDGARLERAGVDIDVYANRRVEAALEPKPRNVIVFPAPPPFARGGRRQAPADIVTMPAVTPPPDPTSRLKEMAEEIGSALEFMAERFGPPPLKSLTVAPIPGAFGQGFPGLVYLSTLAYLNAADRPAHARSEYQQLFFSELLHAHETAHQWWGNLVTSGAYQDDWLMEALANYSAMMHLENKSGRKAFDSVLLAYRDHLLAKNTQGRTVDSLGPIVWGVRLDSSAAGGAGRVIVYEKGSWIIHMLRMRMGDERFLKMLGELVQRKRHSSLSTEKFREVAAEFLPPGSPDPKLEAFFEQWVYNTGIPSLRMKYTVQGKAPKMRVRGTITQTDADDEFSALVPVEVQLPGKRTITKWVRTSSEPVDFTIDVNAAPVRVLLDPGHAVLARK